MATIPFNTDLTPKVQGTNLADMINMARGLQQYQQSEQANPLALQKARMEIEQAQKINPLEEQKKQEEVAQAKTTTKKGTLGFSQDQTKIINENIGSVLNDERLTDADPKRRAVPLVEARQRVIESGVDPIMAEVMFAPIIDKAMRDKNPNAVADMLSNIKNIQQSGIGATGQTALQTGGVVEIGGVKYQFNPITKKAEQIGAEPPKTPPASNTQKTPVPKGEELFKEDMPIVPGAIMQLNERQKARYDEGDAISKQSIDALGKANEMTQSIRKIRQTINSAAGSLTGQALRNALKGAVGSAEYETLTKNLEDLYVRNTAAMGGDTDAARESIRKISGSADMTREALEGIVDRVDASSHALKKFNQGFSNYAKNTSTENANIHARQFQQAWTQNADPLVFMAQQINASNKSKAEKELMQQKMLKDLTDDEITALQKKAKNIKRLEAGKRILENN
jgi:hypothetical protein